MNLHFKLKVINYFNSSNHLNQNFQSLQYFKTIMTQDNNDLDVIIDNLKSFKPITHKQVKLVVQKAK